MITKVIVWTDGSLMITRPIEGNRKVKSVRLDGQLISLESLTDLDELMRKYGRNADAFTVVEGESDVEVVTRLLNSDVPSQSRATARVIERTDLPSTRSFRDAWTDSGSSITIDMTKAKSIQKWRLLLRRDAALTQTNFDLAVADDDNNQSEVNRLKAKAKRLRKLASKIDSDFASISTPDALLSYDPGDLT